MAPPRLEPVTVQPVIDGGIEAMDLVKETLDGIFHPLTEHERKTAVKPPVRFPAAAKDMVLAVQKDARELALACGFDGVKVLTAIENAEAIGPLIARIETLLRTAEDTRLAWLAEAYDEAMPLYRMAQGGVGTNPALQSVVEPFDEMFSDRKKHDKRELGERREKIEEIEK